MQVLEGHYYLTEVQLGFVFVEPSPLEMKEQLASGIVLQQEVEVPLAFEAGMQQRDEGEVGYHFREDLLLPENLLHSLELDKVVLVDLLESVKLSVLLSSNEVDASRASLSKAFHEDEVAQTRSHVLLEVVRAVGPENLVFAEYAKSFVSPAEDVVD